MATKKRPQDEVPSLAAVERDAAQFLEPDLHEHEQLNERMFNAIGEAANLAAELPAVASKSGPKSRYGSALANAR
jgi:hypothetical protein